MNMIYYGRSNYVTNYSMWNFHSNCAKDQKKNLSIFSNLLMILCIANMSLYVSKRRVSIELLWWKHSCFLDFMFYHRTMSWWLHWTNIPINYTWSMSSMVMDNFSLVSNGLFSVRTLYPSLPFSLLFFLIFSQKPNNNNACRSLRLTFFILCVYHCFIRLFFSRAYVFVKMNKLSFFFSLLILFTYAFSMPGPTTSSLLCPIFFRLSQKHRAVSSLRGKF